MKGLVAFFMLVALPASAYVQTRSKAGTPVHWNQSCIVMQADIRGDQSGDDLDISTINKTLATAVANWNGMDGGCTFLRLGAIDAYQTLNPISDGTPSVVFESEVWDLGSDLSHDMAVIALTTVWFTNDAGSPADGLIYDADIALDAVHYTFTTSPQSALPRDSTVGIADLQNTLTHELGHVQGLAHTCWNSDGGQVDPLDNNGNPIPDCQDLELPAVVVDATMYPYAAPTYPENISMRTLSPDDVAGICDNYPSTGVATACYGFVKAGGCELPSHAPSSRWPALIAIVPLPWIARRRLA